MLYSTTYIRKLDKSVSTIIVMEKFWVQLCMGTLTLFLHLIFYIDFIFTIDYFYDILTLFLQDLLLYIMLVCLLIYLLIFLSIPFVLCEIQDFIKELVIKAADIKPVDDS